MASAFTFIFFSKLRLVYVLFQITCTIASEKLHVKSADGGRNHWLAVVNTVLNTGA